MTGQRATKGGAAGKDAVAKAVLKERLAIIELCNHYREPHITAADVIAAKIQLRIQQAGKGLSVDTGAGLRGTKGAR